MNITQIFKTNKNMEEIKKQIIGEMQEASNITEQQANAIIYLCGMLSLTELLGK